MTQSMRWVGRSLAWFVTGGVALSCHTDKDITAEHPLVVSPATLKAGVVSQSYVDTLYAQGGDGEYHWSLISGWLPSGLSISAHGVISGTPIEATVTTFTVLVATGAYEANGTFTIETDFPPVEVVSVGLSDAIMGVPYRATLQGNGGSGVYQWELVDGVLPEGLGLRSDGVVAGVPTEIGTFTFEVALRSSGSIARTQLRIVVGPAPLAIWSTAFAPGTIGIAYRDTLRAVGGRGAYSWTALSGLPPGLSLGENGTVAGIPAQRDTATVAVRVVSHGEVADANLAITIFNRRLTVVPDSLPPGVVGSPYRQRITTTGGQMPTARQFWSVAAGSLPPGLSISGGWNGWPAYVEGVPTVAGTYDFTLHVNRVFLEPSDTASRAFRMRVGASEALKVSR